MEFKNLPNHLVFASLIAFLSACAHKHVSDFEGTAVAVSLKAMPGTISKSKAAKLNWEAKNVYSIFVMPDVGRVFHNPYVHKRKSGGLKVEPKSTTTYVATAWGPNGSATSSTTVTVTDPTPESLRGGFSWGNDQRETRFQEVRFTGRLISTPTGHGDTSFSIMGGAQALARQTVEVYFSKTGLHPGRWTVTAFPKGGAKAISCEVDVPGAIRFSEAACRK